MYAQPTNRLLRFLVTASTVAVVVCYAWLASRLLEPQYSNPEFISQTFVREADSRFFLFEEKSRDYLEEMERLGHELSSLETSFRAIGFPQKKIEILVDEKQSDRLAVSDSRVEIGRDILLARGQLQKAVLKAWLLQVASPAILSSHLRLEVASDVLLAMLAGDLRLEVPGRHVQLTFESELKPWFSYADSYEGHCTSSWRPLELNALCAKAQEPANAKTATISQLSFREFLGNQIWKSYRSRPFARRLDFMNAWIQELKSPKKVAEPNLREGWLPLVKSELEILLPTAFDPIAFERAKWSPQVEAPLIVVDEYGQVTAPGTLRLVAADLPIASAKLGLMTSCEAPKLSQVLSVPVSSIERMVWKPSCKAGDFVQVRPSAIRLALKRGLALPEEPLDEFVLRKSPWFGVADAKWDSRLKAYQVRGAIQAVETFRLEEAMKN